jgi:hypothetical protein
MPVKIDFPDRNTRIHFERTLRKHCGMKASMSLPFPIRKYQALFLCAMKERYDGKIITARPDTSTLFLVAFIQNEGDRGWSRCQESIPLPRGIMLPGFEIPNRVTLPAAASISTVVSDEDDALLVEASIRAESQP